MRQVPADDFEARYRLDDDPWQFATSEYEQRRFDITVASLPPGRFGRVFEPGCAGGELTVRLSQRCDELVACDGSPTVLRRARQRVSEAADPSCRVELDVGVIPEWWPIGEFDLIVLSEIGYYFDAPALSELVGRVEGALVDGGTLLAVHWRGVSGDHLLSGDEVHTIIGSTVVRQHQGSHLEPGFRLDWWTTS
ncbi:MAG: methyltransferase domain-containing protein [Actinomycetota bacterium]|nr:methyltransferase domain-containing protein [Actinomycetota bacterium]